jgi:hypothetical protein
MEGGEAEQDMPVIAEQQPLPVDEPMPAMEQQPVIAEQPAPMEEEVGVEGIQAELMDPAGQGAAPAALAFTPGDCRSWLGAMRVRAYVPLFLAFVALVAQVSLLGRKVGRGVMYVSILASMALALFLLTMLMAARFSSSGQTVTALIVLTLLALLANVALNFWGLVDGGPARSEDYQLWTTVALGALFLAFGSLYFFSYARQFDFASKTLEDSDRWASEEGALSGGNAMQAVRDRLRAAGVPDALVGDDVTPLVIANAGRAAKLEAEQRRMAAQQQPGGAQQPGARRFTMPAMPAMRMPAMRMPAIRMPAMPAFAMPSLSRFSSAPVVPAGPEADEATAAAAAAGLEQQT